MDLGLTDKVAIITGASDGIGKAAARRIAAEGGTVMIIARTESTLNAAADELSQNSKGQVIPVVGDVCDPDLPKRVVEEALKKGFILFYFLFTETSIRISPPLTISNNEIIRGCQIIKEILDK